MATPDPHRVTDGAGRRLALVVGTSSYKDPTLTRLRAPGEDAQQLASVLGDRRLGDFDVEPLVNAPADAIRRRIAGFCRQGNPQDLALVYLSCHGVLDDRGRLYYATVDTERELLSVTAISATWLIEHLEDCKCRQQILILDCCHSGAFAKGAKGAPDLALQDRVAGRGRVVLTASRATEYSFEGDDVVGRGASSVFTRALVAGMRTGHADVDGDGLITVNELYDYAYRAVTESDARQNPGIWSYGAEGMLLVARSPRGALVEPTPLPEHLKAALENPGPRVREGAVAELEQLLGGPDSGRALTARERLEHISLNDVPLVAQAARRALDAHPASAQGRPGPPARARPRPVAVRTPPPARSRIAGRPPVPLDRGRTPLDWTLMALVWSGILGGLGTGAVFLGTRPGDAQYDARWVWGAIAIFAFVVAGASIAWSMVRRRRGM